MLQQIGVRRGQTVLDFGCGSGIYTIPAAKIVGEHGIVYALDKDKMALDNLMREADSAGLKNIERMDTSGGMGIGLTDELVDVVLLFDVFYSFYFPRAEDRRKLLGEIYRIMKPAAFFSISVWPDPMEPGAKDEIKNADFHVEKEVSETLTYKNKNIGMRSVLNFRKAKYIPALTN
ncbi:MAG: class I SAM-dependent methyltransferase [Thermodesulfobacteriota bacterium]|nr:class I SAM-dependent methyltransferase [Thermodesulfobacteriota bacterium]